MRKLCQELQFPAEAVEALCDTDRVLCRDLHLAHWMENLVTDYFQQDQADFEALEQLAAEAKLPVYQLHMVFLLRCAKLLREKYRMRGVEDGLFLNSMADLRYKLMECHQLYGIWGTFVLHWYAPFFRFKRFGLGRLQYELRPWTGPDCLPWVKTGEEALWCHIPSAGPLTQELVLDSLKQAYRCFGVEGELVVVCSSWMLYPPHFPLFAPGSNLDGFRKLFHVFDQQERENVDLWRIFGTKEVTDPAQLPQNTALQRRFAQWLSQGHKMGCGKALLRFDGKTVLTKQEEEK